MDRTKIRTTAVSVTLVATFVLASACAKQDATPPAAAGTYPAGSAYPAQQQYPAQQGYPAQAGYPAQQQYPAQTYPAATAAPATGVPTAPAAGGAMATPGPLALPCSSDSACGFAHCNTQFSKCAFPCQSAADCITGNQCNTMTGLCLPGQ